jgi:Domain of unknown function (DUF6285)
MQDNPHPDELISAVASFLRQGLANPTPHALFTARVAANSLDICARELRLAPKTDAEEQARLTALLGREGDLPELNRQLCAKIASGEMDLETPGLVEHLWLTTLAKLEVDQPNYASYRRALALRGQS